MRRWLIPLFFLPMALFATGDTLVCIHGYMRTHHSMNDMATTFNLEGWNAIKWSYAGTRGKVQELGEQLAKRLALLAEENPGRPISFVTHSLGGLVLRAAINDPSCPREAKEGRAILLACPNQGSRYGRAWGRVPLVRSVLARGAGVELLTEPHFDYLGPFPETMEVLCVGGSKDSKVRPHETRLSTYHWRAVGPYYHTWIANQPDVIILTRQFLNGLVDGQRSL